MGVVALAVAGVAAAGASAYAANKQGDAAQAAGNAQNAFMIQAAAKRQAALDHLISSGTFDYTPVDATAEAQKSLTYNTGAITQLNNNAARINSASANSFHDVMSAAMGRASDGGSAYDESRSGVNSVIQNQLNGFLSTGTQTAVARGALSTGSASLGSGSVRALYSGYLGLTAEQQAQSGVGNFTNLANMYASHIPLTSGAQLMPFGGLSSDMAIQTSVTNSQGEQRGNLAMASSVLQNQDATAQMGYTGLQAMEAGNMARATADGAMAKSAASAIGSIAGAYAGYQNNPALGMGGGGYGGYGMGGGGYGYGGGMGAGGGYVAPAGMQFSTNAAGGDVQLANGRGY